MDELSFNLYKIIKLGYLLLFHLIANQWVANGSLKLNIMALMVIHMARHNVCLVARGFIQVEGFYFNETFSPITWMESIRALLVVTTIDYLEVHQMHVKTIFLNGNLLKEIYIQLLEGFVVKGKENIVCKFQKSSSMVWSNLLMNGITRFMHIFLISRI